MLLRTLALAIIGGISALAQDCSFVIQFQTTAGSPSSFTTPPYNNKITGCVNWQVFYFTTGVSGISIQFESAPDNGPTPGSFGVFAGSIVGTGTNPMTSTTQAAVAFNGGTATTIYPWVRVNITSVSGTGIVTGRVIGTRTTTASSGFPSIFVSSGAQGFFGTFITPNFSTFSYLHQNTNHVASQYLSGINFSNPVSSGTTSFDALCQTISNIASTATTITAAFQTSLSESPAANFGYGLGVAGASVMQEMNYIPGNNQTPQINQMQRCTTSGTFLVSSCAGFSGNGNGNVSVSTPFVWMRLKSDGLGNIAGYFSVDGNHFTIMGQNVADTTAGTNACFFYYALDSNWANSANLVSWNITTP
jgi:hypothetical protein